MFFFYQNQRLDISTLKGSSLKLVDKFNYLGSSVSTKENDIKTRLAKIWSAIDWISVIWGSDLSDKIKCIFSLPAVLSIIQYGCTVWTLKKRWEKMLESNCTRMLRALMNISYKQHPTKQQLYVHLPPICKTIQVRRTRHAGHYWRSKDELINNLLLSTPSYGRASVGRQARVYLQQLSVGTECSLEDLPEATDDRDEW